MILVNEKRFFQVKYNLILSDINHFHLSFVTQTDHEDPSAIRPGLYLQGQPPRAPPLLHHWRESA